MYSTITFLHLKTFTSSKLYIVKLLCPPTRRPIFSRVPRKKIFPSKVKQRATRFASHSYVKKEPIELCVFPQSPMGSYDAKQQLLCFLIFLRHILCLLIFCHCFFQTHALCNRILSCRIDRLNFLHARSR